MAEIVGEGGCSSRSWSWVEAVDLEVGDEEVQQIGVIVGEERWIACQIGAASWWIERHR